MYRIFRKCSGILDPKIVSTIGVSSLEKIAMIRHHLSYLLQTKPYKVAMLEIRSHAAWYLKGLPHAKELKQAIFATKEEEELLKLLEEYETNIRRNYANS